MKTFTVKFTRKNKPAKYIPNAVNYRGYLMSFLKKGVGEAVVKGTIEGDSWEEYSRYENYYCPYFDSDLVENEEVRKKLKEIASQDGREIVGTPFERYLIKFEGTEYYSVVNHEAEKARKRKEKRELAFRTKIETDEVFLWSSDVVYSRSGHSYLHSLGILCSEKNNFIQFYDTSYEIPNRKKVQDFENELKECGYKFNSEEKKWEIEYSEKNIHKAIEIYKKHDIAIDPIAAGMAQCWECGAYFFPRKNDWQCGMPYCGC